MSEQSASKSRTFFGGLFRRRECVALTVRGWMSLFGLAAVFFYCVFSHLHPFLSRTDFVPGGVLVVEGWVPDYALEAAAAEFRREGARTLFVTGGPLDKGAALSEYKTYAELGAACLLHMGLATNEVQAVPAPEVRKDRTYASALELKKWLREHSVTVTNVTLMSMGAHSARSRLLFQRAFGDDCSVGVIAIGSRDYDAKRWWQSSEGVRIVIAETLAYGYARFLFHPAKEE